MKRVNLIPQEKNNYCVCSVLQGIFLENDIKISQDEIAINLTSSKNGFLVNDNRIKKFMEGKGFDYKFYWYNETPLNEPALLLEEISIGSGFIGLGIHTYRVLEFKEPLIISDNPENSSIKSFNLYDLRRDFEKSDGGFGLIRKLK